MTPYTLVAQDVILLGKLLTTGELPKTKVVALAGPAVKESHRKYYRIPFGASLEVYLLKPFKVMKYASSMDTSCGEIKWMQPHADIFMVLSTLPLKKIDHAIS